MNFPQPGDYIDIHSHGGKSSQGLIIIENLMAHEEINPKDISGQACTVGIHPWYLNEKNVCQQLDNVKEVIGLPNVIAVGEAGFDKLKGADLELQRRAFEEQIAISEKVKKPVIIHCVRCWDELFSCNKRLGPQMPWLIHGFRGNVDLAKQLISKGMYLSFWFDFVIRPESANLLKRVPKERIFLETDGADIDIRYIYDKVASDLDLSVDELKSNILTNFKEFFSPQPSPKLRTGQD